MVKAPVIAAAGVAEGVAVGDVVKRSVGEGVTLTTAPVVSHAAFAAGRKEAKAPAIEDIPTARRTRMLVRKGLSRRRDALTRCPRLEPRGTGQHCTPRAGIPL